MAHPSLLERIEKSTLSTLCDGLDAALEAVDDTLFKLADKAGTNQAQSLYFEAMRTVRLHREAIERRFRDDVSAGFKALPRPTETFKDNNQTLRLVETDELERTLAVAGMADRVEREHRNPIEHLRVRFNRVLPDDRSTDDWPVAPRRIARVFAEAMRVAELDIEPEVVMLKLFDTHVMSRLGPLYADLNELFMKAGVGLDLPAQDAPAPRQTQAEDLLKAFFSAPAAAPAPTYSSGDPGGGFPALPMAPGDIAAALSNLPAPRATTGFTLPAAAIKQHLVQTRESSGRALGQMDERVIDLVAMLFDVLLGNPGLTTAYKSVLGRFQIPMIRLALLDQSVLLQRTHPARRLVNAIARAGYGAADDETDPVLEQAERAAETCADCTDSDDWERAARAFEAVLERAQDTEAQIHERAIRREVRAQSDAQVRAALDALKGNASLPAFVDDFMDTVWRDWMKTIYNEEGLESTGWSRALETASLLVWTLLPKKTDADIQQMVGALPGLLRELRAVMRTRHMPRAERTAFLDRLAHEHGRISRRGEHETPPVAAEEHAPVVEPTSGAESFLQRKAKEIRELLETGALAASGDTGAVAGDVFESRALKMPAGTWLEVCEEGGSSRRMKLSWRSEITGLLYFVNHRGLKEAKLSTAELAEILRENHAKILRSAAPQIDEALPVAVSRLREN
ncbi:DUF1631 family protein [Acidihalobacter ferrooxydans]|uniref:Thymidine phosphorylase n=1 Tax=Acidihalobacter ferrooxydans TaxID=1765967 RepID=A0A1P8UFI4_9GAMM|nr:DUF1631 family protein [Acidihalobacter ferrooxydans]APZ42595.1 hypothetical protein BW247_05365 [Acidihalobacter ferrooxydans]